jgi:spectinomycin phosphotransferase
MKTIFTKILDQHYNQSVINIAEQEGGWSARAFRVDTTNGSFFLKAYEKHKAATEKWTSMIDSYMPIVLWLSNNTNLHGKIIFPVLTNNGQYKCEDDHFIYLLFPYIEGYTLCDKPMSVMQKKEMAEIISGLHKYGDEIPVVTNTIKEDYAIPFCHELKELISLIDKPTSNETMSILKEHEAILIRRIYGDVQKSTSEF